MMVPTQPQAPASPHPWKASSLEYLVEAKQIMAHVLQEASEGAVSQQGAVSPVVQGAIVGHMPDPQILSLDVEVTRVLESNQH